MDQQQKDDILGNWCIGVAVFCLIGLMVKLGMEACAWFAT